MAVRAKKTFTLKEYKEVTGTVGIFKKISFNAQIHAIYERYLKAPKTKSYIHIPIWYFRIPLKSKFKKKVAHYKVTKDHDASKRGAKYLFSEFAEKYGVKVNRDFRYKFKKIIKEL